MHPAIIAASGNTRRNLVQFLMLGIVNSTGSTITSQVFGQDNQFKPYRMDWGDGTIEIINSSNSISTSHVYSPAFTGYAKYYPTTGYLRDIRQLRFGGRWNIDILESKLDQCTRLNYFSTSGNATLIGDIASLPKPTGLNNLIINASSNLVYGDIANLPIAGQVIIGVGNTVSGLIQNIPVGIGNINIFGSNTISGNIALIPNTLTTFSVSGNNTITGNIGLITSPMTALTIVGNNTVFGNIANVPPNLATLRLQGNAQTNQYTAGRVWRSDISDIRILPAAGFGLTSTMVDNILIDLANSVTSITSGGLGTIFINGNNAPRTAASNAAINYLSNTLGFNVQTN